MPSAVLAQNAESITVYNAQHESLTKEWVQGFTKETGITRTAAKTSHRALIC